MKPDEIATDISGLDPVGSGNITQTVTGTQSFVGGSLTIDDWSNWG